jgi:hypothetical protein
MISKCRGRSDMVNAAAYWTYHQVLSYEHSKQCVQRACFLSPRIYTTLKRLKTLKKRLRNVTEKSKQGSLSCKEAGY